MLICQEPIGHESLLESSLCVHVYVFYSPMLYERRIICLILQSKELRPRELPKDMWL